MGVETICCPDENNQVDLKKLMKYLGEEGIDSILLEGGGTLNDSALRAGIVQEVQAFIDRGVCGNSAPAQINFLIHIVILSPSFSDI